MSSFRILIQEVPVATTSLSSSDNANNEIVASLGAWMQRRAHELLGLQDVQGMLDQLESVSPALVRNVVPKPVSLPQLTDILRRLLEEGVSVRPLREILEALATFAPLERDAVALSELVRVALRRGITHRHAQTDGVRAYLVDPAIEDTVRDAIQRTATGTFLALSPSLARDITDAVRKATEASPDDRAVVLTQPDVRRFVRRLLEAEFPDRAVLSYSEIAPEVIVTPVARITI